MLSANYLRVSQAMSKGVKILRRRKKLTKRRPVRFCVVVGYVDRLVKSISKIFLQRENRALLSTAEEIYGRSIEKSEIANSRIVEIAK